MKFLKRKMKNSVNCYLKHPNPAMLKPQCLIPSANIDNVQI